MRKKQEKSREEVAEKLYQIEDFFYSEELFMEKLVTVMRSRDAFKKNSKRKL